MYEDYQLVVASGSDNLSVKVTEYLDKGYDLYEGPQLSQVYLDGKVRVLVSQAVVLFKEEEG